MVIIRFAGTATPRGLLQVTGLFHAPVVESGHAISATGTIRSREPLRRRHLVRWVLYLQIWRSDTKRATDPGRRVLSRVRRFDTRDSSLVEFDQRFDDELSPASAHLDRTVTTLEHSRVFRQFHFTQTIGRRHSIAPAVSGRNALSNGVATFTAVQPSRLRGSWPWPRAEWALRRGSRPAQKWRCRS